MHFTSSWCLLLCYWNCFLKIPLKAKSFLRIPLQQKPFAKKQLLEKEHSFADDKSRSPHGRCCSVFTFLLCLCPAPCQAALGPFWLFDWLQNSKGRARLKIDDGGVLHLPFWNVSCGQAADICCKFTVPLETLLSHQDQTLGLQKKKPSEETIQGLELVGWNFLHWNVQCCQKREPKIYALRNENWNWSIRLSREQFSCRRLYSKWEHRHFTRQKW